MLILDILWPGMKLLTKSKHPFGKFSNGNRITLKENPERKGVDTFTEMRKQYRNNYSTNRMALVIFTHDRCIT